MKFYLKLQLKILYRKIKAFGVPPALGFLIITIVFFYLSNLIYTKYNNGIYALLAFQFIFQYQLANSKKISFLKAHFTPKNVFKIRFLENLSIGIFFISFLVYKLVFIEAFLSLILSFAAVFISANKKMNWVTPTPFKSKTIEFILTFRKLWFLILLSYLLIAISIKVDNFNLGVFSLLIFGIFGFSAHSETEKPFYVWIYNQTPQLFLKQKIKNSLLSTLVLCTPNIIILLLIDIYRFDLILITLAYITLLTTAFILLKYSKFPNSINAADGILFILSAVVIPFFIILIPMWHKNAKQQLKAYLHDNN